MPSEIQVPPIVLLRKLKLINSLLQHLQPLLSLRTSNYLTHFWSEDVKGSNSFSIRVLPHVESFDLFWIVVEDHWTMEDMIAEVSLML